MQSASRSLPDRPSPPTCPAHSSPFPTRPASPSSPARSRSRGWEIISTGGTARALREAGIATRDVADVTGFPEMIDGRVKTLHPAVHGGLLARRDLPEHMAALAEHDIEPIDLVAVNLYPFRETAARAGCAPGRGDREHRHRRAEHAPLGGEELRVGVRDRRPRRLRPRARGARREGEDDLDLRRTARGEDLRAHGGVRRGDRGLVREAARASASRTDAAVVRAAAVAALRRESGTGTRRSTSSIAAPGSRHSRSAAARSSASTTCSTSRARSSRRDMLGERDCPAAPSSSTRRRAASRPAPLRSRRIRRRSPAIRCRRSAA